jgi:hypothetical protein
LVAGSHATPADEKIPVEYQDVIWDSDGYFDDQEPTRFTVPAGLGGRYFVRVVIRWFNTEEARETPPPRGHQGLLLLRICIDERE